MRLHELLNEDDNEDRILKTLHEYFIVDDKHPGDPPDIFVDDGLVYITTNKKFSTIVCRLSKQVSTLPVKFGTVMGRFSCSERKLTSLEGSPNYVGGVFSCFGNNLTNLIGGPRIVMEEYNCHLNPLQSLDGLPEKVGSLRIGYRPNLPLLKILTIPDIDFVQIIGLSSEYPFLKQLNKIMNIYLKQGKKGVLLAAAELSKIGCKGNARL